MKLNNREHDFIIGLEKLSRKTGIIIGGCGCCGSPTCMSFAEDFVRGEVKLTDCIFLREPSGK